MRPAASAWAAVAGMLALVAASGAAAPGRGVPATVPPAAVIRPAGTADGSPCSTGAGTPPNSSATPYWLGRVRMDQAWQVSRGAGVTVAVVDSGVQRDTPALASAVLPGQDVLGGGSMGLRDTFGHGTMVAGIIAARPVAGSGVVGIAPAAKIYPILQTAGDAPDQRSNLSTLATAIRLAVQAGAGVVNISEAARPDPADPAQAAPLADLRAAIDEAYARNVVVVAAAGNWNDGVDQTTKRANANPVTFPASLAHVLAVGAVDQYDTPAGFSERGAYLDVAAPGVGITSTWPGGGNCQASGTSFAAPYVAGVAALIKARWPELTVDQVIADIEQTAMSTGSERRDDAVGFGVADPVRALTAPNFTPPRAQARPATAAASAEQAHVYAGAQTPEQVRGRHIVEIAVGIGVLVVVLILTTATVTREANRRRAVGVAPRLASRGRSSG